MKYIFFFLVSILLITATKAQSALNMELKQKLDSLMYKDQTLRKLFDNTIKPERKKEILTEFGYSEEDFKERFFGIVDSQDSINLKEIEEIISEYGYPGKKLVGEPTNQAAWYVIQHSNKIEKYFPIIKRAGKEGELELRLVAMMQDRMLMDQGKEQIYGTQVAGRKIEATGRWFHFVWPVKDPESVNEKRKNVGFETTVEENAKRLDVEYQVYTLKQIDSLLNPK